VNTVEIQGLLPSGGYVSEPTSEAKPAQKSNSSDSDKRLLQAEEGQLPRITEEIISMSNAVAGSDDSKLSDSHLSFSLDEDTGTTVINIIDNKTEEVLRQIPPDGILKLKKRLGTLHGILLDKKI